MRLGISLTSRRPIAQRATLRPTSRRALCCRANMGDPLHGRYAVCVGEALFGELSAVVASLHSRNATSGHDMPSPTQSSAVAAIA